MLVPGYGSGAARFLRQPIKVYFGAAADVTIGSLPARSGPWTNHPMVHAYGLIAEQFCLHMKKTVCYLVTCLIFLLLALWIVAPRQFELLLFIPYVFFRALIDR